MKREHLDLAELWSCLSGECTDAEIREHFRTCPLCRRETLRWQTIFQQEAAVLTEKVERLPGLYWQKLETEVHAKIMDPPRPSWALLFRPAAAMVGMLLLACWVGWYGSRWTPISAEQIDLAANYFVDYSEDAVEEQLWVDIDRLIRQAPYQEVGDLFFGENRLGD